MWIIFNISKYYYKFVNVDKGGGGVKLFKKTLIVLKNVDKIFL